MREATTPDEIRHCGLMHIAGFGSLNLADDRPAGVDGQIAPDNAADAFPAAMMDAELDASIERLGEQTAMSAGDWKELRLGQGNLDKRAIEEWIATFEFNHLDLHVEWFGEGGADFALPITHWYDERMEQPDDWSVPQVEPGDPCGFLDLNRSFECGELTPMVNATFDANDGHVMRAYANDVLIPELADNNHQLTDDSDKALEWVIAIRETATNSLIPVFPGAWLRWRAEYDGDFNQLDVLNWNDYRRKIASYIEYWDDSTPLDPVKARAKAAELEAAIRQVADDGIKPVE
ncbi:hypothetical protein KIH79_11095 [Bifidobacterium sp. 82T10]|uniref:Uncharacterized protein n=1 Tax=Bifidobacterium miconis TaxID=2834435 RepID=A0ABS6WHF5_9BIFI|nr:hypothetical protein [Bifidobacterium miconis]MBW3093455.1 hypothetical protein [Bifidobacterium miconis]